MRPMAPTPAPCAMSSASQATPRGLVGGAGGQGLGRRNQRRQFFSPASIRTGSTFSGSGRGQVAKGVKAQGGL
jgi:hypothetical protein